MEDCKIQKETNGSEDSKSKLELDEGKKKTEIYDLTEKKSNTKRMK